MHQETENGHDLTNQNGTVPELVSGKKTRKSIILNNLLLLLVGFPVRLSEVTSNGGTGSKKRGQLMHFTGRMGSMKDDHPKLIVIFQLNKKKHKTTRQTCVSRLSQCYVKVSEHGGTPKSSTIKPFWY